MENKRGLSAIVITVILVALVLVAVGVVWAVVNNLIQTGTESSEMEGKCLTLDLRATKVSCTDSNPDVCNVTFERTGSGSHEIGGTKIVFRDSTTDESSSVIDVSGNIQRLVGKTEPNINTTLIDPDEVEVTAYFIDDSGNEYLCSQTIPFEF